MNIYKIGTLFLHKKTNDLFILLENTTGNKEENKITAELLMYDVQRQMGHYERIEP